MSKVSIIVPYFKGAAYLEECIDSIEKQNFEDYEILLIDDRDGDAVPENVLSAKNIRHIVMENEIDEEEYNKRREEYLKSRFGEKQPDGSYEGNDTIESEKLLSASCPFEGELEIMLKPYGVAMARNLGVKLATGDYIYFLDADDYILDGALSKLVMLAEEKNAKVVTGSRYASWYRPVNFTFEKAKADFKCEGNEKLEGKRLVSYLKSRFTIQHLLIRKDYYDSLNASFDDFNMFFSDMPVVANVLINAKDEMWIAGESVYVWRRHNDPIHIPALCQKKRKRKLREYIESYEAAYSVVGGKDSDIEYALNRVLVMRVTNKFVNLLSQKKDGRYLKNLRNVTKVQAKQIKNGMPFETKLKISKVLQGKYKAAKRIDKIATAFKKMMTVIKKPSMFWRTLDTVLFQKMKMKENWVFVESFFGKSYSDSPKYLYEYMYDTYGDRFRYIWCLNERAPEMKGHPSICKRHSLRYIYYLSRSKYFITNTRQPTYYKKRKEAVFLETWHGTPLKKLAFDLDDIMAVNQDHKKLFYKQGKAWDYLISANRFSTDVFERAFCYPREQIIEVGYPRNDILYSESADEIAKEVKAEFGIPEDKRVILYAPTWRDNQFYGAGRYKFTLAMDLERMRKEFGKDSVLLLRTHYHIADNLDITGLEDFVYNGSKYNDVSRLYLASDICITDYSSVFFDYANLKRPMLFFAYDYEDYKGEIRGMYFDMNTELPGPILQTNDELVEALHNIDEITEKYKERYEVFYEKYCSVDDGQASKRAIEIFLGHSK